ncbi:MAG: molybdenum cofactor guanylyltransferase [Bacteroidales bacterium]|nr:molybdenum cofactor guanylyltransferase [Bacteroidales bacterium]
MTTVSSVTGIVLAGGKSLRMGTDKGLMSFRGKPLVQYSIDLLGLFCDRILISSNNQAYSAFGYEIVPDQMEGAGPMAGISACLSNSKTEFNLVLSCDMPLADRVIFQTLIDLSVGYSFVVPVDSFGRIEPLCAIYKTDSLKIMQKLLASQSYRMTELFRYAPARMVAPEEYPLPYNGKWFMNVNTISDFEIAGNL